MRQTRINRRKGKSAFTAVLLAAVLASGSYALTAANTVSASKAGDGTGAVSGYSVSGVSYNLNATNPASADSVEFTLNSTPVTGSTIKAQVVSGGTWHSCTNLLAVVTCTFTGGQAVASIDQLRVVAAD